MSSNSITIKPNNHRVYQCPNEKKIELLNKLISENMGADIVIACSKDFESIKDGLQNKEIKVIEDKELVSSKDLQYEVLLSYDLGIKAIVYMARVAKATAKAILLLDASEQKELYHVEMLLGRAIKQEVIEGFEYPVVEKEKSTERPAPKKMTQEQIKELAKKRYDEKTQEPKEKDYKPKRNYDEKDKKSYDNSGKKKDFKKSDSAGKWDKKKKEDNKFLGYDDNGKAKFSGKSGDRNHRHDGTPKDKWDAPKKVGRKINIQARKPSKSEE